MAYQTLPELEKWQGEETDPNVARGITYMGSASGLEPTFSQQTTNPRPTPEQEAALAQKFRQWEEDKREAERQRELMAQSAGVEEASKAAAAAMQFQGMRGYQEALKSGMPAEQALGKWAPMLFANKSTAMAAAIKAAQPKIMNVGGVGYRVDPSTGSATAITPPPVIKPPRDLEESSFRSRLSSAQAALDKATADAQAKSATRKVTKPAIRKLGWNNDIPEQVVDEPIFESTKADEARAARDAAQARVDAIRGEMQSYLAQQRPVAAPVTAPAGMAPGAVQPPAQATGKPLTKEAILQFRKLANGDREKARELAIKAGYSM